MYVSKARSGWGNICNLLFCICLLSSMAANAAEDSLAVTFYDYPPKMMIVDGRPVGWRIDQMTEIASTAGMKISWIKASIRQEADMLEAGQRKFCATGRSYSPARSAKWRFLPYYLDALSEHVIVARAEVAERIRALGAVDLVLKDKQLTGVLLQNYIYGPTAERVLKANPPWIIRSVNMVVQELDMVRLGRADYTIVPMQRWRAYQKATEGMSGLVSLDTFGAMPKDSLYIACSRAVDDGTIEALERAMASLGYRPVDFNEKAN